MFLFIKDFPMVPRVWVEVCLFGWWGCGYAMDPNMNNKINEKNHYYNSWFFKLSKLIALFVSILNMSILTSLNDKCVFKLIEFD
jgi:hypothetical protein